MDSPRNWSFSQEFYTQFQTLYSDLESLIELAKSDPNTLQKVSAELAKLTKSLVDATGSLPAYEQRRFQLQLDAMEQRVDGLRSAARPTTKFSFKRRAKPHVHADSEASALSTMAEPPSQESSPAIDVMATTNLTLSSRNHCYLTLAHLADTSLTSDLTISDLDHCIVNILSPSVTKARKGEKSHDDNILNLSALHIRNIRHSILLLPVVTGSVLLHDLLACIVIVGCHQFRIHNSQNVDVYIEISSKPVIEHSTGIRFGVYPEALIALSDKNQVSKLSGDFYVDDFSHIRTTPSPNWSILPLETRPETWFESALLEGEDVELVLKEYLPE